MYSGTFSRSHGYGPLHRVIPGCRYCWMVNDHLPCVFGFHGKCSLPANRNGKTLHHESFTDKVSEATWICFTQYLWCLLTITLLIANGLVASVIQPPLLCVLETVISRACFSRDRNVHLVMDKICEAPLSNCYFHSRLMISINVLTNKSICYGSSFMWIFVMNTARC